MVFWFLLDFKNMYKNLHSKKKFYFLIDFKIDFAS